MTRRSGNRKRRRQKTLGSYKHFGLPEPMGEAPASEEIKIPVVSEPGEKLRPAGAPEIEKSAWLGARKYKQFRSVAEEDDKTKRLGVSDDPIDQIVRITNTLLKNISKLPKEPSGSQRSETIKQMKEEAKIQEQRTYDLEARINAFYRMAFLIRQGLNLEEAFEKMWSEFPIWQKENKEIWKDNLIGKSKGKIWTDAEIIRSSIGGLPQLRREYLLRQTSKIKKWYTLWENPEHTIPIFTKSGKPYKTKFLKKVQIKQRVLSRKNIQSYIKIESKL